MHLLLHTLMISTTYCHLPLICSPRHLGVIPCAESKRYKAAIIRIDSPGGDALASDL